jgi:hypothetical protein
VGTVGERAIVRRHRRRHQVVRRARRAAVDGIDDRRLSIAPSGLRTRTSPNGGSGGAEREVGDVEAVGFDDFERIVLAAA